ncbi:bifunctional lysylphosphatidylglycerol flippase/synthetase MprF [Bacillus sp. FJAT-50079]|uniref:bifunctional lysylphosphatidylglycerol flippase/synthetase MprF n=1 Tax=Bacillus sp. FJAT-50079 TaxID=2833577 RepID=UPI001BCA4671|nr:bifunctional lysylphosphatidylglycerol flippase/synthetase MprF [Bacillus sp. FJAT-50079]MBS4210138.1 bifunctional lysylphosphatidylglycerol flippase/synthetase MprF [Bacillus sp. FJAT-50079]
MKWIRKERLFQLLQMLFPLLLLVLAIFEIQKIGSQTNMDLLRKEVSHLNNLEFVLIFLIGFCAISPMFLYDVILVKILGINIPLKMLLKQSFIVNTFSNIMGFGGIIGLALRSYFFTKHKAEKQGLLGNITSITLFSLTGLSLLAWIVLVGYRDFSLLSNTKWIILAVIAVCCYLPLLLLFQWFRHKRGNAASLNGQTIAKLVMASLLEWIAIFFVIWYLVAALNISISVRELIPIFLIACSAGVVSMIPGGIGSFDLVFIWGMESVGIQDEKVLALLIFYRLSYFFFPFLLSSILFIKEYWDKWNRSWNNLPNIIFQNVSHSLLTLLVFLSGLILLLSAAVPGILNRLKIAEEFLSQPVMNVSHQLTVAAGFLLLGLCRGIEYKVKRAYHLTIFVLSLAAIFSVLKGIDYEETIFLFIVALLLVMSKKRFYREGYVLTWGKAIFDFAIIFVITAMYVVIGYVNLPTAKFNLPVKLQPYIITDYRDLFYSAIIGIVIAGIILILGYVIRQPKQMEMEASVDQEGKIKQHLLTYTGTEMSHLIFLHDKFVFWNEKNTVLFSYQTYADKIIILGDPVGKEADFSSAIANFLETADLYGYQLVFYEISDQTIPYLHEYGFDFFKLGEAAFIQLNNFSLSGKKAKNFRTIVNKFEREGYKAEILSPPYNLALIQELKVVSDQWLGERNEKGFSLGYFDEHYLNQANIIVLKGPNQTLGFASIMPMYNNKKMISVDLMRFTPNAPNGTMDLIFLSLFHWAQDSGYQIFNLGMAPLSNVGLSKFSFLSEKIAAQMFLHGQFFYHFKGLRKFKDKYADFWKPKYLAYRKKSSLSFTMAQITLLISKKTKS